MIRVFRLFYESKLLGIESINDPKGVGEDSWKTVRFRVENGEEKSKRASVGPWSAAPPIASQDCLSIGSWEAIQTELPNLAFEVWILGPHASQSSKDAS